MKKLSLLLLAISIMVAVTVALLWKKEQAAPGDGPAAEVGASAETRAAEVTGTAAAPAKAQDASASPRERLETPATASALPGSTWRVLVLTKDKRAPVAEAEVAIAELEEAQQDPWEGWGRAAVDAETLTRKTGKVSRSDARGEARVPRSAKRRGWVTARKDELYGEMRLENSAEPLIVLLERDVHVSVRVVDAQQQPVLGVPVVLRAASGSSGDGPERMVKSEAPDGIARFAHMQRGWYGVDPAKTGVALARAPGVDAKSAPFSLETTPVEPIVLVMPPTGSVLVRVQDSEGQPCRESGWVNVQAQPQKQREAFFGEMLRPDTGSVRIPFVGLGLQFAATGYVSESQLERRDFPGPGHPGEEVAVTLELSKAQPLLTGRALDAEGEPLAACEVSLWLGVEQRGNDELQAKTDAAGRFRFLPDRGKVGKAIQRLTLSRRDGKPGVFARAALPRTLVAGTQDLGDLKLVDAPLLIAGTVLDDLGAPVDDAQVGLEWKPVPPKRNATQIESWSHDVATRKLGEGRFEIRGELPQDEMQLRVLHRDYVAPPRLAFARGQTDARVTLVRGGVVNLTALIDEGMPPMQLRLFLRPPAGGKEIASQNPRPEAAGRLLCSWRGLAAETYELVARSAIDNTVVKTVGGIVIEPGKVAEDERAREVDLRGLVRKIEVSAVDAAGEPIKKQGSLAVKGGQHVQIQNGKAKLWIGASAVDVTLTVAGFRKKTFAGLAADATVTLEQGLVVKLAFAGLELPPDAKPSVTLRSASGGPGDGNGLPGSPGMPDYEVGPNGVPGMWPGGGTACERDAATGEFRGVVNEAGVYNVTLTLAGKIGRIPVELGAKTIVVLEATEPQRHELPVTKDELDKALKRARG